MNRLTGKFAGDFQIRGVRADFNFVRPRNLAVVADVDFFKKRLVPQRRENAMPDRIGQIHNSSHAVRVVHADSVTWQNRNVHRPNHAAKVPLRNCGVKVQAVCAAGIAALAEAFLRRSDCYSFFHGHGSPSKSEFHCPGDLFSGLTSFAELESRIAALPEEKSRGDAFEVFAEAYLATQRKHDAAQVWPHGSVPLDLLKNLGLTHTDYGVDGVLQTLLGQFNAYQIKFRTGRPALTWRELSNFIGLADPVSTLWEEMFQQERAQSHECGPAFRQI